MVMTLLTLKVADWLLALTLTVPVLVVMPTTPSIVPMTREEAAVTTWRLAPVAVAAPANVVNELLELERLTPAAPRAARPSTVKGAVCPMVAPLINDRFRQPVDA